MPCMDVLRFWLHCLRRDLNLNGIFFRNVLVRTRRNKTQNISQRRFGGIGQAMVLTEMRCFDWGRSQAVRKATEIQKR